MLKKINLTFSRTTWYFLYFLASFLLCITNLFHVLPHFLTISESTPVTADQVDRHTSNMARDLVCFQLQSAAVKVHRTLFCNLVYPLHSYLLKREFNFFSLTKQFWNRVSFWTMTKLEKIRISFLNSCGGQFTRYSIAKTKFLCKNCSQYFCEPVPQFLLGLFFSTFVFSRHFYFGYSLKLVKEVFFCNHTTPM